MRLSREGYSCAFSLVLLALSGCGGYSCHRVAVEEPKVGDTREAVVAAFGEPGTSKETVSGRFDVYEFRYEECSGAVFPVPYIIILPLIGGSDAYWTVVYGTDDRVLSVVVSPSADSVDEALASAIQPHHEKTARRAELTMRRKDLEHRATQGDVDAAIELDREFGEFIRRKDLEHRATQGDVDAAMALAREFGEFQRVDALAEHVRGDKAYEVYKLVNESTRNEPGRVFLAWKWLCKAANDRYPKALMETGYWHRSDVWRLWNERPQGIRERLPGLREVGVRPDDRVAYMWYTLAASEGASVALEFRRDLGSTMSRGDITEAQRLAKNWTPGQCPVPN